MRKFAQGTAVPIERSKAEIEKIVRKYGATAFVIGDDAERNMAGVIFTIGGKRCRFNLPLPERSTRKSEDEARRLWRCMTLCIKSKMEAVSSGIVTFEEEFFPHFVTPSGQTVAEVALPQYLKAIEGGKPLPPLLGM